MLDNKNLKILLVEDNEMFLNVAKQILHDYQIIIAKSVEEGFKQFSENIPDITFVDIGLPDGNGHQLLGKIMEFKPDAFVVMLTASRLKEDIQNSLSEGAKSYIVKPFSVKRVKECIKKYQEYVVSLKND